MPMVIWSREGDTLSSKFSATTIGYLVLEETEEGEKL